MSGFRATFFYLIIVLLDYTIGAESGIGVNWGTVSFRKLKPSTVVDLLKDNNIQKVKLFDTDPDVMKALVGSGIQVMVGIPNEMLASLSSSTAVSDMWVRQNISTYLVKGGVDIRYIAVGNEPFLSSYSGQFQSYVVPALQNLQQSLAKANLAGYVKLVVPCNADAYESSLPSQGTFRPELTDIMTQLVSFLNSNGSPFVVNIYPFLSLYGSTDFPQDYAFFGGSTHPVTDGNNVYDNAFDGNFDTLVAALSKIGYGQMPIVIGEVGWPTDGAISANLTAARAFNQGLIKQVLSNKGTPLRPGSPPLDIYLFSLLDEGAKSTLPGNFERHWGIFSFDGQAKYSLNLGLGNRLLKNARNVQYLPSRWCVADPAKDLSNVANHLRIACSVADCTTLNYGGSCNEIGAKGNISYAFNSYYQLQDQDAQSCDFDGLGMVTFLDPSVGDCRFLVGVTDTSSSDFRLYHRWTVICSWTLWGMLVFLI
ncbi:glucan endo-1,3-beta-glucosidase 5 [Ricinus communis]|uniref:glucan endo-1,3-beta-D-glucosidase n=1 Tax=Ricinus communis TaxID=3988 RepID=B9SGA7_RICCO|nr:glucan endo-1,3-beta-glucosidase 5 [Ricinus communis]EEF37353.1 Glucan endo-1,3-beta-glucosidase precursor, putative [Ricinus communis]|eukprot:XP_002525026.1 glucan endo-1,3-beta-glucosidase 5 [Ricinus communis]